MSNPTKTLVFSHDLGSQFTFDATSKTWKIAVVSTDAGNLVSTGSDGGAKLSAADIQAAQTTYHAAIVGHAINLYKTAGGVTTLQDSLDTTTIDMTVTGASITAGVLTLSESNGGPTVTVDLSAFLKSVVSAASNAVALTGAGTAASPLVASLTLDPLAGNLLKVGVSGAKVDPSDILALLNANVTVTAAVSAGTSTFDVTVNGTKASASVVEVLDSAGTHQGWMFT